MEHLGSQADVQRFFPHELLVNHHSGEVGGSRVIVQTRFHSNGCQNFSIANVLTTKKINLKQGLHDLVSKTKLAFISS
jgi:hypothetical protein